MNDPAVLFYTSDFLTGVIDMSMEERGMYITLLCYQHQKGHIEEKTIRFLLGYPNNNLPEVIMKHFKIDDEGKFYNERMDLEKDKRVKFVETRRENGSKGGRPSLKNEKPLGKPSGKPLGKPKNNLMGNENDNENINNNIYKNNIYFNNKELNNIFKEYLKIRIKLKAVNSERAIKSLLKKLEPFNDDIKYQMIEQSIIKSWKDIYELKDDYKNEKPLPEWFGKEIGKEDFSEETERLCREVFGNNKE